MFEDLVLSDVHVETCPPGPKLWSTTFQTLETEHADQQYHDQTNGLEAEQDEDGDIIVPRRRPTGCSGRQFVIHHHLATPLAKVGLQVWRGALLLADYILSNEEHFRGVVGVELGSGSGLAGLALSCVAQRVFLTDAHDETLELCEENVRANTSLFQHGQGVAQVRRLDWCADWPPQHDRECGQSPDRFEWSPADVADLQNATVMLGADVVYDENLTEALLDCAERVLRSGGGNTSGKVFLVALEKRWNFTLRDMDARAPAFDHFCSLLHFPHVTPGGMPDEESHGPHAGCPAGNSLGCMHGSVIPTKAGPTPSRVTGFVGTRIPVSSVKQQLNYERGSDLELWELRLVS